jgi:membrane AbrB-like protein
MLNFMLTVLCGAALGYLTYRLKIPGGVLVGGVLGAAALNIAFAAAYVPVEAKVLAQLLAGAFIGCTVTREDLRRLRHIWRPALLLLSVYMVVNIGLGLIIYAISPLDLITSLFSVVPGGISEVPLIAADMGAQPAKVAALQFVRSLVCTGLFPAMIDRICRDEPTQETHVDSQVRPTAKTAQGKRIDFMLSFAVALVCGALGWLSRVPAGTLVLSMFGVIALNLSTGRAYLPRWAKRTAQLLSGIYIGSMMGLAEFLELRFLLPPMLVSLAGYTAFCFGVSYLLRRFFKMPRKEAMLAATPAGGSDMALISLDMGVQSADLVLLQVIRLVAVIAIFPQVINLVYRLMNGG